MYLPLKSPLVLCLLAQIELFHQKKLNLTRQGGEKWVTAMSTPVMTGNACDCSILLITGWIDASIGLLAGVPGLQLECSYNGWMLTRCDYTFSLIVDCLSWAQSLLLRGLIDSIEAAQQCLQLSFLDCCLPWRVLG